MKIFELFKNKNLSSKICQQTGFSQFLSLAFNNCASSMENSRFFQKKAKKSKISKFRPGRKKYISEKKFFHDISGSRTILRWTIFLHGQFFDWTILRSIFFSNKAENSSPDNSSPGQFFVGPFFARTILRRTILQLENSSPDNSSPRQFLARTILRSNFF
jgi:hypothetical protein